MIATASPAAAVTCTPNASAPRASAGRSVAAILVPGADDQGLLAAGRDHGEKRHGVEDDRERAEGIRLHAARRQREHGEPEDRAVNLIASAAALPLSTSLLRMKLRDGPRHVKGFATALHGTLRCCGLARDIRLHFGTGEKRKLRYWYTRRTPANRRDERRRSRAAVMARDTRGGAWRYARPAAGRRNRT